MFSLLPRQGRVGDSDSQVLEPQMGQAVGENERMAAAVWCDKSPQYKDQS